MYNAGNAPWEVWKSPKAAAPTAEAVQVADVESDLRQADRATPPQESSASEPTATTSRSAAAATMLRLLERARRCGRALGRLRRGRATRTTRRRRARAGSWRTRGAKEIVRQGVPRRLLPVVGAEIKDVFEALKRTFEPDLDPHALPRRSPPGPPAGVRPDLEHVPRPPDPRIRDPQVRWRPRQPELLRAAERAIVPEEDRRPSWSASRARGDKSWFTEDVFSRSCGCAGSSPMPPRTTPRAFTPGRSATDGPARARRCLLPSLRRRDPALSRK